VREAGGGEVLDDPAGAVALAASQLRGARGELAGTPGRGGLPAGPRSLAGHLEYLEWAAAEVMPAFR